MGGSQGTADLFLNPRGPSKVWTVLMLLQATNKVCASVFLLHICHVQIMLLTPPLGPADEMDDIFVHDED